ncbi:MAG: glycerol-3-phosphate 1-O-acyltransferase PlsY [Thermoanaerobacterales bacterium]|nr:glycerol-3-phosphate 1-O-acyltransferase PlsY [Bacillota bacterium]MDI6906298.1 glycerol-3-phosphate 1-O-acyltransferase PlsY [Thermoanaerobacterales bacterium]
MTDLLWIIPVSYLLGSLPFGYLVGRLRGVDITAHGSGNIGATNALRTLGPVPALIVLAGDMGKGVLAVWLGQAFGPPAAPLLAALAVLAGHGWSIFLGFRGGKMIATSLGVLLMLSPQVTAGAAAVWAIVVALTRYVSLGSILAAVAVPVLFAALGFPPGYIVFAGVIAATVIYKHRSNIARLRAGTESRLGRRSKK